MKILKQISPLLVKRRVMHLVFNLLQAVNEDLSNKLFLAEVRALGIVDKIVTGPFWRIVENVNNILAINPYLLQLRSKLTDLCADATPNE